VRDRRRNTGRERKGETRGVKRVEETEGVRQEERQNY
jgi:hypothetical protein